MSKSRLWLVSIFILLCSCSHYTPRPEGYIRIERDTATSVYRNNKFSFRYSALSKVDIEPTEDKNQVWLTINYPSYNATIYCSYLCITDKKLAETVDDSHKLAYSHASRAEEIIQKEFRNEEHKTFGILYDIKGEVAVPVQFFVTDSISNFFRGSFYYNDKVNRDSVAPITDYLRDDIKQIMETLEWVKKDTQ